MEWSAAGAASLTIEYCMQNTLRMVTRELEYQAQRCPKVAQQLPLLCHDINNCVAWMSGDAVRLWHNAAAKEVKAAFGVWAAHLWQFAFRHLATSGPSIGYYYWVYE